MNISRTMLVGWLTLLASALAVPQVVALIPESALPWVTVAAGASTLLVRWLSGQFGMEPLTFVGVGQLLLGLCGMPELANAIPPDAMPYVTAASALVTLTLRWKSGQDATTADSAVGFLVRKPVVLDMTAKKPSP